MNNINKIRIIYTDNDEALKEYVKYFFEFIGIMVCEYRIEAFDEYDKVKDLYGIPYDKSVVDIALGNVCTIIDDIISENKPLELNLLCVSPNSDISKTQFKEDLLDEIISKIWGNDSINLPIIQKIRKLFVSADENRDLFQILYGEEIIRETNKLSIELLEADKGIRDESITEVMPSLNNFIKNKFNELASTFKVLFDEYVLPRNERKIQSSPYGDFVLFNIQKHLYQILSLFKRQIEYAEFLGNEVNLDIGILISTHDLKGLIIEFLNKYPEFSSAKYSLIGLRVEVLSLCDALIKEGKIFQEKKYYSKAALVRALEMNRYNEFVYKKYSEEEITKTFELACSYDQSNLEAKSKCAHYVITSAKSEVEVASLDESKEALEKIEVYDHEKLLKAEKILAQMHFEFENNYPKNILALKKIIDIDYLLFVIALLNRLEYSMKFYAESAANAVLAMSSMPFRQIYEDEEIEKIYLSIMIPFRINLTKKIKGIVDCTILENTMGSLLAYIVKSSLSQLNHNNDEEYDAGEGDKTKIIGTKPETPKVD